MINDEFYIRKYRRNDNVLQTLIKMTKKCENHNNDSNNGEHDTRTKCQ